MITTGIDQGSNSIKFALIVDGGLKGTVTEKIKRRTPRDVVKMGHKRLLREGGVTMEDVDYIATTGEGDEIEFRTGHFYSMTTHARGGYFLDDSAEGVVDIGALYTRAILMDNRSKVLNYKMTSQCASGSGQFLENISRYLGVAADEIGALSLQSKDFEECSSICAVLAETDAINMVSRGIKTSDIVKGIHISIAKRIIKLLKGAKAAGNIMLTGGLSQDVGQVAALKEVIKNQESKKGVLPYVILTHPKGSFAGAIGAALWGAFRAEKLKRKAS